MPNPNFTGTVPRMRCETCKHWARYATTTMGHCRAFPVRLAANPMVAGIEVPTTDLSVCSNWTAKEPE